MNAAPAAERPSPPAGAPVLLLTGASRGLGRQIAEHYLAAGWRVAGCSRGPTPFAHSRYRHFVADVADEAAVVSMVRSVDDAWSRLDALIANAGTAALNHLTLTPGATLRRILETNVLGSLLACREAAKAMIRRRRGRIVLIGSVAAPLSLAGEAAYAASKEALSRFAAVFAREVGGFGITCNVVAPGPVRTDLLRGVGEERLQRLIDRLAIRRLCTPADVLNCLDFFLDDGAGYVTGQTLYLGGPG